MRKQLSKEVVLEIYNAKGKYVNITKRYGVKRNVVYRIKSHQSYTKYTLGVTYRYNRSFNKEQVIDIYTSDLSIKELSIKYRKSMSLISDIVRGVTYKSITKNLKAGEHRKAKYPHRLRDQIVADIFTGKLSKEEAFLKYNVSGVTWANIVNGTSYTYLTNYLKKGEDKMNAKKEVKTNSTATSKAEPVKKYEPKDVVYIGTAKFTVDFANNIGVTITSDNQALSIGYNSDLYKQLRIVPNEIPKDKEPTLYDKVKVGDEVWHSMCGWCPVSRKQNNYIYLKYKGEEIKLTAEGKHKDGANIVIAFQNLQDYTAYHLQELLKEDD